MKNKELKEKFSQCNFGEIEEMEKVINGIKLEFKTGKKLLKENEITDKHRYSKAIMNRS